MTDPTSTQVDAHGISWAGEMPRIVGTAIHGGDIDVPLFSQITDKLWVGGSPAEANDPLDVILTDSGEPCFDAIMNVAPYWPYIVRVNQAYQEFSLMDSLEQSMDSVDEIAAIVDRWIKKGYRTLVHCQAGLNRSNVVAARVLMMQGMAADEAISLLRAKRSMEVLCNEHFENWLRSL